MRLRIQLVTILALLGYFIGGALPGLEFLSTSEKLFEVGERFAAAATSPDQSKVIGYCVSDGKWTVEALDSRGRSLADPVPIGAPTGVVERLAWSQDGQQFAAAAGESVLLYDFSKKKLERRILKAAWQVREVAFRGDYLLARCNDNLYIWHRSDWKLAIHLKISHLITADLSQNGKTLLLGVFQDGFRVIDIPSRKVKRHINKGMTPSFLSFCDQDRKVMSAYKVRGSSDFAILHSLASGEPSSKALAHDRLEYCAVSEDGSRVLTRAGSMRRVWNTNASEMLCEVAIENGHLDSLSQDGKLVATSQLRKNTVQVWSTDDGRVKATLGHRAPVTWLEFCDEQVVELVGATCALWRI